jgi:hypothetical protein
MPTESEVVSQPQPPTSRMDGWALYHTYFHKLNADMEVRETRGAVTVQPDPCPHACLRRANATSQPLTA